MPTESTFYDKNWTVLQKLKYLEQWLTETNLDPTTIDIETTQVGNTVTVIITGVTYEGKTVTLPEISFESGEYEFNIGTVTTLAAGSTATVTANTTDNVITLNFGIPKGDTGDKGEQGIQGETGEAAVVTVGAVETLEAGEDAYVENTGSAQDVVLNFGIPKGIDGTSFKITGSVDSVSDLPTATSALLGTAYYVGTTAPRTVYACVTLSNGAIAWEDQGKLQGPTGATGANGLSIYDIAEVLSTGDTTTTTDVFTVPSGYTLQVGDLCIDTEGKLGQVYSISGSTVIVRYIQTLANGGTGVLYRHNITLYINRDEVNCATVSFTLFNASSSVSMAVPQGVTYAVSGIVYPNSSTAYVATRLTVNTSGTDTIYTIGYWDYPSASQLTYEFTSNDTISTQQTIEAVDISAVSVYTAGDNISISDNNVISATDTKYTAGTNISISSGNVISATDTKYTAGDNISISDNNVISATDTKYTAGDNISISDNNVISATATKYTAGDGIDISDNIINVEASSYTFISNFSENSYTKFSFVSDTVTTVDSSYIHNITLYATSSSGSINMIVNFAIISESSVAFNSFEECCAACYSLYGVKPMPCSVLGYVNARPVLYSTIKALGSSSMELVYCTGYTSQTIYGVSL